MIQNIESSIIPDHEILRLCREEHMIVPYHDRLIREIEDVLTSDGKKKIISYGLSSYGYDLKLCSHDFRIFRHRPGEIVDPRDFNPDFLEKAKLNFDGDGMAYFILPGHSYGLGVTIEQLSIPADITALFFAKSTYARCGIGATLTPGEAGWNGYLTVELCNASAADVKIYANQGIIQAIFLRGTPCSTTYASRAGKYQGQEAEVTLARV